MLARRYLIFFSVAALRNFARSVFRMAMPGQKGRRNYFLSLLTIFYDELFVSALEVLSGKKI